MTIKQLTWRLKLPLTVVSFGTFTKWWYVLVEDAPDTMMIGFPLPYACNGWHTSMSLQIFVLEFMVDFLIYFSFWFLLIVLIHRYLKRIKISKILSGILWVFSTIIFAFAIWISSFTELNLEFKREWEMGVIKSGFKPIWIHQERPVFTEDNQEMKSK